MNTRLLLCATVLAAPPLFLAAVPPAATAGAGGGSDCHEQLTPAVLPHTADAIEGWFRDCYARQGELRPIGPAAGGRGKDNGEARNRGVDTPGWMPHDPPANWRRLINEVDTPLPAGWGQDIGPSPSTADGSLEYVQIALGALAGVTIMAAVTVTFAGRRRPQRRLEAALASDDPDELPRAAGLLGDRFVQQDRVGAAEHAYRAAIDAGDQYWSPIAQIALARLMRGRGQHAKAQALFEAALASGHPRAVPAAQASLDELLTGEGHTEVAGHSRQGLYETLGDSRPVHRSSRDPSDFPHPTVVASAAEFHHHGEEEPDVRPQVHCQTYR